MQCSLKLAAPTETRCCHFEESLPARTQRGQLPCEQNGLAFKGTCAKTTTQTRVANLRWGGWWINHHSERNIKTTAYLFCKDSGDSHNLSLKLVTSWNKGKQDILQPGAVAIASFCSHPTENTWQVGRQRCHQLPALQMWEQHQWTSTGRLYGLPWSLMAHVGFGMSKRPAKSLFKRAFFFLSPFREPIQATHCLDQKRK